MRGEIPVAAVQQGLTVAHARDRRIPSPGVVDGLWGERSAASYDAWAGLARFSAQAAGYDVRVDLSTGRRQDFLTMEDSTATALRALARGYVTTTARQDQPAPAPTPGPGPTPPPPVLRPRMEIPWTAIGILAGTVAVVGVGFWLVRRKRRRR